MSLGLCYSKLIPLVWNILPTLHPIFCLVYWLLVILDSVQTLSPWEAFSDHPLPQFSLDSPFHLPLQQPRLPYDDASPIPVPAQLPCSVTVCVAAVPASAVWLAQGRGNSGLEPGPALQGDLIYPSRL